MSKKSIVYKFQDIAHRLHTLEPDKSYITPFVTANHHSDGRQHRHGDISGRG